MKIIFTFIILLIQGCYFNDLNYDSNSDEIIDNESDILASYRMLNYYHPKKYVDYNSSINLLVPPPRNQNEFFMVIKKSNSGDYHSSLLLFNLFKRDSNCDYAMQFLNRAINQSDDNSLALYELGVLNFSGKCIKENKSKAIVYFNEIINKDEVGGILACSHLTHIYLFNDNGSLNDIKKAYHYANIGANQGSEICKKYRDDIAVAMNVKTKITNKYFK